jgi:hypothetical protein
MHFDSTFANHECFGDLAVTATCGKQARTFPCASRQNLLGGFSGCWSRIPRPKLLQDAESVFECRLHFMARSSGSARLRCSRRARQ